ncbi:hypothetical protein [Parvularcula lutaonensis]|uniref:DUF3995 domain-containing protein n=1 Tax=Parvularcula lutaonensis TaxID=491923 RepID=A0ABV7M7C8_9PROT|nr:hypothetical protein [Parvularcula lutaonensis]GGY40965.1 hypothetical protein GCM10007148_06920 [Parvularcula lutaonensis]
MRALSNILVFIGTVGLMFLVSHNFYQLLAESEGAASFLSEAWWSQNGLFYASFAVLLLVGIIGVLRPRRG